MSGLPCTCCARIGKSLRMAVTSRLVAAGMQPLQENLFQPGAQRPYLDPVNNVAREGMHQQIARLFPRDAARLHVEDGLLVELANRRTVCATNIVGVNLQLGFGMDGGVFGKNEIPVCLLGVSLLRVRTNDDLPVKNRGGCSAEDALIQLMARAMGLRMIDHRVIIDMLAAGRQIKAIDGSFRSFREDGIDVVPYQAAAAERNGMRRKIRVAADLDLEGSYVECSLILLLQLVMVHYRVIARHDLGNRVREIL